MATIRSVNIQFDDIPDLLIAKVGEYLPTPSCAILALALTTHPSASRRINWNKTSPILKWATAIKLKRGPSAAAKLILSRPCKRRRGDANCLLWEVLDFGEVERSLAAKLTDDDLAGIFLSINAVKHLKILKLTGCINIVGHGLDPLTDSLVLEHLDLCLVGPHEDPEKQPESLLSMNVVVPILQSIIGTARPRNSLRYLALPHKIRKMENAVLAEVLGEYDEILQSRGLKCSKCNLACSNQGGHDMTYMHLDWIRPIPLGLSYGPWPCGVQGFTCNMCTKFFCIREECDWLVGACISCEKEYCKDCVEMEMCTGCNDFYCIQCKRLNTCNVCEDSYCDWCYKMCNYCGGAACIECLDWRYCKNCNKSHCGGCFDGKEHNVKNCGVCDSQFCFDCQFAKCNKSWNNACEGCLQRIEVNAPVAAELQNLTNEINQLQSLVHKISVEGCGVAAINGVYTRQEDYFGAPLFRRTTTTYIRGSKVSFTLFRSPIRYRGQRR